MQSKLEKVNVLPEELKIQTAQNLSNPDLASFSMTSKYHLALFKPMIDVRKLLYRVTRGEHDLVKTMLKKDMSLIFKRGIVTDCSGREFENVSSFEYALWSLDKHMWSVMIVCIPQNEEGRKVFAQLIAQYNKANTDGVTYRLNGQTITEQHFDFENTIIKELRTQLDLKNTQGVMNWDAIDKQWREGVGGAQKLLPMHVVNEYCSDEPFCPVPKFTSQPKSSKQFYNGITHKYENWFSLDSKLSINFAIWCSFDRVLSVDFAIYKGWADWACGDDRVRGGSWCKDLDAMMELCKIRTKDFINLKSQLEEQAIRCDCVGRMTMKCSSSNLI